MLKIGFLGCGNMASAFINGLTQKGGFSLSELAVFTRTKEKADAFLSGGAVWCDSPEELASLCETVFICVKPQQAEEPLKKMATASHKPLLVSILAGKKISFFEGVFGTDVPVIRLMPNTPLLLGCGATTVTMNKNVSEAEKDFVLSVLSLLGEAKVIDESLMDAAVAVNGSSPAYFYLFIKAMTDWAEQQGIDRDAALSLAAKSMLGSARMIAESRKSPEQLIRDVCSPGGTTLAALSSFEADGFADIIARGMDACKKRSAELSENKS